MRLLEVRLSCGDATLWAGPGQALGRYDDGSVWVKQEGQNTPRVYSAHMVEWYVEDPLWRDAELAMVKESDWTNPPGGELSAQAKRETEEASAALKARGWLE